MTQTEAAIQMGLSRQTLIQWKKEGCPALQGKDIDPDAVELWRKENKPESYQWSEDRKHGKASDDTKELKAKKLRQDIKRGAQTIINQKLDEKLLQISIDKANGKLISAEESAADIRAITEEVKSTLQFKMVDQLPVLLEGKSIAEIRPILEQTFTEILGRWQAFGRRHGVKA